MSHSTTSSKSSLDLGGFDDSGDGTDSHDPDARQIMVTERSEVQKNPPVPFDERS